MILLWRRECQHIPVFLPREFHGQRILAGYSAWGHEESNTIKQLTLCLSLSPCHPHWDFLEGTSGKEPGCQCRRLKRCRFDLWVGQIPWRRAWQPIPVFLSGESHGQRSLADYSSQGHKESDRTEVT